MEPKIKMSHYFDQEQLNEISTRFAQEISKRQFTSLGKLITLGFMFQEGIAFAEKELESLAVEFVEWLVGEGWIQAESYNTFKNVYHANIEENVRLTTQELFEIFKQENYESNK